MVGAPALFVSKRLNRSAIAVICLVTVQVLLAVASCEPEPTPMAAKVAQAR